MNQKVQSRHVIILKFTSTRPNWLYVPVTTWNESYIDSLLIKAKLQSQKSRYKDVIMSKSTRFVLNRQYILAKSQKDAYIGAILLNSQLTHFVNKTALFRGVIRPRFLLVKPSWLYILVKRSNNAYIDDILSRTLRNKSTCLYTLTKYQITSSVKLPTSTDNKSDMEIIPKSFPGPPFVQKRRLKFLQKCEITSHTKPAICLLFSGKTMPSTIRRDNPHNSALGESNEPNQGMPLIPKEKVNIRNFHFICKIEKIPIIVRIDTLSKLQQTIQAIKALFPTFRPHVGVASSPLQALGVPLRRTSSPWERTQTICPRSNTRVTQVRLIKACNIKTSVKISTYPTNNHQNDIHLCLSIIIFILSCIKHKLQCILSTTPRNEIMSDSKMPLELLKIYEFESLAYSICLKPCKIYEFKLENLTAILAFHRYLFISKLRFMKIIMGIILIGIYKGWIPIEILWPNNYGFANQKPYSREAFSAMQILFPMECSSHQWKNHVRN